MSKQNNCVIITKHKGKHITVIIGRYMVINMLNKEAKIQFIKHINEYIMKNFMKNTNKKSALYVRKIASMQHKMI
jgi:hypothetical protein